MQLCLAFAVLVSLALAAPASAQEDVEFYAGFPAFKPKANTGFNFELRLLHEPGTSPRPDPPLERANFFSPDGTRFGFTYTPAFCVNPPDCPRRSLIGSGEIIFNYGPRGDQGFKGDVFAQRGGFVYVPTLPLGAPEQPFAPPPPIEVERTRTRFDVVFPRACPTSSECPEAERAALKAWRLHLSKIRFDGEGNLTTTPSSCPPSGNWGSTADLFFAGGFDTRTTDPSPCQPKRRKGKRRRRTKLQCQVITTYIGAPTLNTGERLGTSSVETSGSCNQRIEGVRLQVPGKSVRSCETGRGTSCQVTTLVDLDDTAVDTTNTPKNQPTSLRVASEPQLEQGDRVRVTFISAGDRVSLDAVM